MTESLWAVARGQGVWVAVGEGGAIVTSTNGVNWTRRVSNTSVYLNSLAYGNGVFVAVGEAGTVVTSSNGVLWNLRNPGTSQFLNDVNHGQGRFIAVGAGQTVWSSTNGAAWTRLPDGQRDWYGVAYGRDRFAAVGGVTVCIFQNCKDRSVQAHSTDGLTWTAGEGDAGYYLSDLVFGGDQFVAVGFHGTIMTSASGEVWTVQDSGTTDLLYNVAYGLGRYVAVGPGALRTSVDGAVWMARPRPAFFSANNVAYGDGTFVAVGGGGAIFQSGPIPLEAPYILTHPADVEVAAGGEARFSVVATNSSSEPMFYRWYHEGVLVSDGGATLVIPAVGASHVGNYSVVVSNQFGAFTSRQAGLVIPEPVIETQPTNVWVNTGASVRFVVAATNALRLPMTYQWSRNQVSLGGETNAVLNIASVNSSHVGDYTVVVRNAYGVVTSQVARLSFLVAPTIVQAPRGQTNVAGDDATFTVTVTNTASLPIIYQWRKGSVILTNMELSGYSSSFTLFNVATNSTATNGPGSYRVVVMNPANPSPGLASGFAALAVLPAAPPAAVTLEADGLSAEGATLHAGIEPRGARTVAWFDYGATAALGSRTVPTIIGNGTNVVAFSQVLTGLSPLLDYHYRVVATNYGGMAIGAARMFRVGDTVMSPSIQVPEWLDGSRLRLRFDSTPGVSFRVLVSTNLRDWFEAGVAGEVGPGRYEFTDAGLTNDLSRYYRVRTP